MKKGEAKLLLDDNRILVSDESWSLFPVKISTSVYRNLAKRSTSTNNSHQKKTD